MKKIARAGFTMIELSLSLVFVGILSITMVLIINNTVQAYRRGMTLNHINTVGMDLVDELRRSVQNASSRSVTADCVTFYPESSVATAPRNLCQNNNAVLFVTLRQTGTVVIEDGTKLDNVPVYGAFCTGTYSYIWNSGYFINTDDMVANDTKREVSGVSGPAYLTYLNTSGVKVTYPANLMDNEPLRLLKVSDVRRGVCEAVARGWSSATGTFANTYSRPSVLDNNFDITGYGRVSEEPVEVILPDDYSDLVLYDFEVMPPAESSTRSNSFYSASFILGTIRGGINILAKGKSCEPPENYDVGNFDYCAINRFNFAAQAGGAA